MPLSYEDVEQAQFPSFSSTGLGVMNFLLRGLSLQSQGRTMKSISKSIMISKHTRVIPQPGTKSTMPAPQPADTTLHTSGSIAAVSTKAVVTSLARLSIPCIDGNAMRNGATSTYPTLNPVLPKAVQRVAPLSRWHRLQISRDASVLSEVGHSKNLSRHPSSSSTPGNGRGSALATVSPGV